MNSKTRPDGPAPRGAARKNPAPKAAAAPATPAGYEQSQGEVAIRMGRFFVRYLTRMDHEFDGDLALIIVLGEIGHHNTCHLFAANPLTPRQDRSRWSSPDRWHHLLPCNTFSLSAATGIPRETVRRKIATLVKRGWVQRNARGEVVVTPKVSEHFTPDFKVHILRELLALSDELRSVLALGARATTLCHTHAAHAFP